MKKSELIDIIREEIKGTLNEAGLDSKAEKFLELCDVLTSKYRTAPSSLKAKIRDMVIDSGIIPPYKSISNLKDKMRNI